jgi:hypothetical protein
LTLGAWEGGSPWFNGSTRIQGVVFPKGSSSVLFFGIRGLGPFCYGHGTDDPELAGRWAEDGVLNCFDPASSAKGTHSYPYANSVWAYDARDLVAVRNGTKQEWEVIPYSVFDLDLPRSGGAIIGAAYDDATGLIYLSQTWADAELPVIHVFHVF